MRVDEEMQSRVESGVDRADHRAQYHPGNESKSVRDRVLSVLQDVSGLDEDGPVLFDSVDPDSLDRLFSGKPNHRENYVRFHHGDCHVAVHATGEVVVIQDTEDGPREDTE